MAEVKTADKKETLLLVGAAGLVGVGLWLGLRKPAKPGVKSPGDPITAVVGFTHQGGGAEIWVGFGYARAQAIGFGDITGFVYATLRVEDDEKAEPYLIEIKSAVPSLPEGKYDLFLFLQYVDGTLNKDGTGFIKNGARWYQDWLTVR